jgi:hypothetical protein
MAFNNTIFIASLQATSSLGEMMMAMMQRQMFSFENNFMFRN